MRVMRPHYAILSITELFLSAVSETELTQTVWFGWIGKMVSEKREMGNVVE